MSNHCMSHRFTRSILVVSVALAIPKSPPTLAQVLEPVMDPVAYAVYAVFVPPAWATRSKDPLVLQRETEVPPECGSPVPASDPDWEATVQNFIEENTRPRELRPELPIHMPYRLIARAEILADDARLALKYPGTWQRRPESLEYAAVSMVGFNPAKTKALVYVRLRSSGQHHTAEFRDSKWVQASVRVGYGCGWVAHAGMDGNQAPAG